MLKQRFYLCENPKLLSTLGEISMKKSLIALATLAAATGAMAQSSVTISGKLGAQFTSTQSNTGVKGTGFNVTDGDVNFAAVEDLGGGLKADVFMGIRLRGREVNADSASVAAAGTTTDQADGIGARNATIRLSGDFGSVLLGSIAAPSGILAIGGAGAAGFKGVDDDGELLDKEVNGVDIFQYQTPNFLGGLNAYVQIVDSIGDPATNGLQRAAAAPSATVLGLNFANGPIKANIDTTTYKRNASTTATADSRLRLSGSYDFGMAAVGIGYQTNDNTTTDVTQMLLGLNVPVTSALSAGINYVTRDTKTLATGVKVSNKGYETGINYSLSKRTTVAASYRFINEGSAARDATYTRVRLMHAF